MPAWSMGELLAVAVILEDYDMLKSLEYTMVEALKRLRHKIGEPTPGAALDVFLALREQVTV